MVEIKDKSRCCGCSACMSVCRKQAIHMVEDLEGFKYPVVDKNLCVDCGVCNRICPIEYRDKKLVNKHCVEFLAIRNKSKDEWMSSSSGGFFSLISNHVIDCGGVVFGVAYSDSMEVVHTYSETKEGLNKFKGSKYVQSNIDNIFPKVKEFLDLGRLVLFSGTPCQVEGLNLFLRKSYDNLITVDIVCHAVPSPKIFKDYVNYIEKKIGEKVVDINMRYKGGRGWCHKFSYLYKFESGREEVDWAGIQDWGRLYFRNVITRPSCHKCRFCNLDRAGDYSIADYWDDDAYRPDIYSKDGTSLVIVNTEKAKTFYEKYLSDGCFSWNISEQEAMQPCLIAPTSCNEDRRKEYWTYYHKYGFEKYYNRFFTDSFYMKRKKILKWIIQHLKR